MGLDRPLQHCEEHSKHQPTCESCKSAETLVAKTWGRYWNAESDTSFLSNPSTGGDDASSPHSAPGFEGFGGGSSGGGGASGDF
jgi:hypothetical protein